MMKLKAFYMSLVACILALYAPNAMVCAQDEGITEIISRLTFTDQEYKKNTNYNGLKLPNSNDMTFVAKTGIYGKAYDDYSLMVHTVDSKASQFMQLNEYPAVTAGDTLCFNMQIAHEQLKAYTRVTMQFNNGLTGAELVTSKFQNTDFAIQMDALNSRLTFFDQTIPMVISDKKWYDISIIMEMGSCDGITEDTTATLYIDGQKIAETKGIMPASTAKLSMFRIQTFNTLRDITNTNVYLEDTVYLDNISLIKYSQGTQVPQAEECELSVKDNNMIKNIGALIIPADLTVNSLKNSIELAEGATLTCLDQNFEPVEDTVLAAEKYLKVEIKEKIYFFKITNKMIDCDFNDDNYRLYSIAPPKAMINTPTNFSEVNITSGFAGKDSSDFIYRAQGKVDNAFMGYLYPLSIIPDVSVFSMNACIKAEDISFRVQFIGIKNATAVMTSEDMEMNKWYKLAFELNKLNKTMDVYKNGQLLRSISLSDMQEEMITSIRICLDNKECEYAFDNIDYKLGNYLAENDQLTAFSNHPDMIFGAENQLAVKSGIKAKELLANIGTNAVNATIKLYTDALFAGEMEEDATVETGNVLLIRNEYGDLMEYYKVVVENEAEMPEFILETTDTGAKVKAKVKVSSETGMVLIIAGYDEDGALSGVSFSACENAEQEYIETEQIEYKQGQKVKAFVFDNMVNMSPLITAVEMSNE